MRPAAWGVDLTGGAVRAVYVERHGGGFRVLDAIVQPVSGTGEGAEPLRAHLPDAVGRGLTDLVQSRRATFADPIFVALPAFGSKQGRIEVPTTDSAQAARLLDFELHQALKGDVEPWLVRARPPARHGGATSTTFHAHRRELVQTFVSDLRRFGLPIDALVPGPLALCRYADLEWPSKGRRLVLEVQRTRTDFVYSTEHGPRWRSLPFGCGSLGESESGHAPAAEVDRLATQILREHQLAHRALFGAHDGTPLDRIVLLGDGARFEALKRALQERFDVEVVVPHAPRHLVVSGRATGAAGHGVLHCGTALGLAIAALSRRGDPDSLVTPPPARRALRRLPALAASLLVLSLGLLATRWLAEREAAGLERQLAALGQRLQWSTVADFEDVRASSLAHVERTRGLIDRAATLRREIGFPARLLQALSDPAVFYRLVALELVPGEDRDEVVLTFEVADGLAGAAGSIEEHLERRAALTVIGVETRTGADGALRVTLRAAVHDPEAGA